jgi:SNF2 family DNA or RNA helicase
VSGRLHAGQKCIVLTGLRDDAEKTAEALRKKNGDKFTIWMAHGDTSATDRAEIARRYMAHPGPCVIVGTSAAWGESLSLHDTDYLAVVQTPWTWGQIRQIEGRVRRLGQRRRCTIEYFCAAGTRDMRVYDVIRPKLAAQETLSDDSHIREVREALAGGTDRQLIDSIFDDIVGGRMKETDIFGEFDDEAA